MGGRGVRLPPRFEQRGRAVAEIERAQRRESLLVVGNQPPNVCLLFVTEARAPLPDDPVIAGRALGGSLRRLLAKCCRRHRSHRGRHHEIATRELRRHRYLLRTPRRTTSTPAVPL